MRGRLRAHASAACLLALLALAVLSATTSAQDGQTCDPHTSADGCPPPAVPEPPPEPRPEPPPSERPPENPPPPPPPAPQRAPVPPPPATTVEAPAAQERTRECRRRPLRQRRGCPRKRRRAAGGTERSGGRTERERRLESARRRAREREECRALAPFDPTECDDDRDLLAIAGIGASRPLPDPIAPGARLSPGFARLLERTAGSRWPVVLAVLRARGQTGPSPADAATLRRLARGLGADAADERVDALADYHRAAGLDGLTHGLHAVKRALIARVLGQARVSLYPGGRADVAAGRIDVRVLVTMLYLAERHGGITVTSLISGHGVFTTSGHISLHTFGRAMDIAAAGGVPIIGNQQPGGVTEGLLRSVMLMPPELRPSELISLFALGGPSFAMADHADHVHIGY